jgi:hypothetical protein
MVSINTTRSPNRSASCSRALPNFGPVSPQSRGFGITNGHAAFPATQGKIVPESVPVHHTCKRFDSTMRRRATFHYLEGVMGGMGIEEMTLLPAQAEFVAAEERFVAFIGGVGSGKTVAGAVKAIRHAEAHAGAVGLVGAPNRTMLRDVLLPTLLELLPPAARNGYKQTEGKITFANGSVLLARSLEDFDHRRGPYYLINYILDETIHYWSILVLRRVLAFI